MDSFTRRVRLNDLPRLPLRGRLDLTYRCNHACRHCWVRLAPGDPARASELTLDEIRRIAEQARRLGTRQWALSGGEPLLREDFAEVFDLLTRRAASYSLNSNATLMTPVIAHLLRRQGTKMMALYGASAATYDRVTGHPGGFEAAMQGFRYLQEAGAHFIVQLIPLRDNWHEWEQMQALARTLSPRQRVGAAWLYLSADGNPARNRQIAAQRLTPRQVVELDQPQPGDGERLAERHREARVKATRHSGRDAAIQAGDGVPDLGAITAGPQHDSPDLTDTAPWLGCGAVAAGDDRLFAQCIAGRREFHIDAYGRMSWCSFITDPALRYDLRQGSVREGWDDFIPSCADKVRGGKEWQAHCGSCEMRADCRWCAVYGRLETGRYSAPIPYLCAVAEEARAFRTQWQTRHRRYFQVAGITVRIESDLNLDETAFRPEHEAFAVAGPGADNVTLRHHFELPPLRNQTLGRQIYRKPPWAISRQSSGAWIYRGIGPDGTDADLDRVAVFSADHRHGTIYSQARDLQQIHRDGWHSLSLFPTDQIWLAPLLADRQAVLLHCGAAIVNGQGLVFIGHSGAGKSTTMELLKAARGRTLGGMPPAVEVLCDDRNVLRKWPAAASPGGWRVHGTWSHGTTADVSSAAAPLRAILLLEQSPSNELIALHDRKRIWRGLLATLIRPVTAAEWWEKELDILQQLVAEVPCYIMRFDRSGAIVEQLAALAGSEQ